ncbi:MAG: TVP38/TMEM64 family protein [Proteobacteria bacterium]|nr:TVP38/TMEM64 family protein [Pseudomonadota bacterium]
MSTGGSRRKSLVRLCIFIFALAGVVILIKLTNIDRYLEKEQLRDWIEGLGMWGPLVYILLYSVTPSLFLPGTPMTVAAGLAFGPFYGTIFAITGATIGASLAFLVARYFARKQAANLLRGRLEAIDDGVKKKGWVFVAITRLIPLFPFNLLNYAFGLTSIRFTHYVLASFVFMLPGTTAYVVFGSSLLDLVKGRVTMEFFAGLALVLAVSFVPVMYRRIQKKG